MQANVLPAESLVYITNYGPFRGLQGTIQAVDMIADELTGRLCFYKVALQGAGNSEPIWFEAAEVEDATPLSVARRELEL